VKNLTKVHTTQCSAKSLIKKNYHVKNETRIAFSVVEKPSFLKEKIQLISSANQ